MLKLPTQLALEFTPRSDVDERWKDGHTRWSREGPLFLPRNHSVHRIAESLARPFVEQHHYSHEFCNRLKSYGLFRGSDPDPSLLLGVAVLANPAQPNCLNYFPNLVRYKQSVELGRFVLLDGVEYNAESWFLAKMFDLAYSDGIRGIVSFSDPCPFRLPATGELVFPGHWGQIYCATSRREVGPVIYSGRSKKGWSYRGPDGKPLANRAISKIRNGETGEDGFEERLVDRYGARLRRKGESGKDWLNEALVSVGAFKIYHPGKHRYLWALDSSVEVRAARHPFIKHVDPEPIVYAA